MKTLSITIKDELFDKLRQYIPQGTISKFVSLAIEEKINVKEQYLYQAYTDAVNDLSRQSETVEWDVDDKEW